MKEYYKPTADKPCIRHCCLNECDVCMGCYRTLDEILAWSKMTDDERVTAFNECNLRKRTIHLTNLL